MRCTLGELKLDPLRRGPPCHGLDPVLGSFAVVSTAAAAAAAVEEEEVVVGMVVVEDDRIGCCRTGTRLGTDGDLDVGLRVLGGSVPARGAFVVHGRMASSRGQHAPVPDPVSACTRGNCRRLRDVPQGRMPEPL